MGFASGSQLIKTLCCILGWCSHQCLVRLSPVPESPLWLGGSQTRGHPICQQTQKMSLEEAELPAGIPAVCNKYLRCEKLTKWNGVRHESEICLFKPDSDNSKDAVSKSSLKKDVKAFRNYGICMRNIQRAEIFSLFN